MVMSLLCGKEVCSLEDRRAKPMSTIVNIGDAKARFSELVAKVEAGEEIVIARENRPVAKLAPIRGADDVRAVIAELRAARHGHAPTTAQEILAWREEVRRDR
ncbi:MAG TPA: type II toxin-antitoxin system prevent-host-death family antitoxin [Xanthobacteraceae bacterium]